MTTEITPVKRLQDLLQTTGVSQRFRQMLNDKAPQFMSSIVTATASNPKLQECDPMSVISAASIAASLDLPINQSLGYAYIIPYGKAATFQMGYLGFVQLFLRSGQADRINALVLREGDIKSRNRMTGEIILSEDDHPDAPVIGYISWFRLLNGFEHSVYMSLEDMKKHAQRYSQSYKYDLEKGGKSSKWSTDFDAMALKTVTKMNLKKFAPLNTQMAEAIEKDEAVETEGKVIHPDAPPVEVLPAAPGEQKTSSSRLTQAVAAHTGVESATVVASAPEGEQEGLPI